MADIITTNNSQLDEVNAFLAQFEEIKTRTIPEIFLDWNVSPLIDIPQRFKFLIWFKENMEILNKLSNPEGQDSKKIKETLEVIEATQSIIFDVYKTPENKQSIEFNEITLIINLLMGQINKSFRAKVSDSNEGNSKRAK